MMDATLGGELRTPPEDSPAQQLAGYLIESLKTGNCDIENPQYPGDLADLDKDLATQQYWPNKLKTRDILSDPYRWSFINASFIAVNLARRSSNSELRIEDLIYAMGDSLNSPHDDISPGRVSWMKETFSIVALHVAKTTSLHEWGEMGNILEDAGLISTGRSMAVQIFAMIGVRLSRGGKNE